MAFNISGTTLVPGEKEISGRLVVSRGVFQKPGAKTQGPVYELPESAVFPGLFNAFDGLLGSVAPRFGRGPYQNREAWAQELAKSRVWESVQKLDPADRLLLGYYRQILSGVTSVFDPAWKALANLAPQWKPIRVVDQYVYLHQVVSAPARKGDGVDAARSEAQKRKVPLVVRAEEGSGKGERLEFDQLADRGLLSPHLTILHGNGCGPKNTHQAAAHKVSWIFSPSSEKFLYGHTADVGALIKAGCQVALGTDSPVAGGQLLLEELRFARDTLHRDHKTRLTDGQLAHMVTGAPAAIFGTLPKGGFLSPGSPADFTVLRKRRHPNAHCALLAARCHDLELVVCGGKPLLARDVFREMVKESGEVGQKVDLFGEAVWLAGKPLELKKRVEEALGEACAWRFFPIG